MQNVIFKRKNFYCETRDDPSRRDQSTLIGNTLSTAVLHLETGFYGDLQADTVTLICINLNSLFRLDKFNL